MYSEKYRANRHNLNEECTTLMANIKVLLLEAPYSYSGGGSKLVKKYFPLGIGYLASYLRQSGHQVKIFESSSDSFSFNDLDRQIKLLKPNLLGIGVMTPSYPRAVEICNQVKSKHNIKTVFGGHHVSAVKEEVLKQSQDVDFAVIGEGEQTLLELVNQLDSTQPKFSKVDGLVWRDGNKIVNNPPRELIQDIDVLPFPARDMVDISKYGLHSYIDFGKKSVSMITSRGCPYKCIFCSSWLSMGRKYRYRSAENIMTEIRELVEVNSVDHIVFEDDTMTLNRNRMEEICKELIEMPNRPSWYCLSRVDTMDNSLAKLMKKAGCRMVGFGIESGSAEVLQKIGKKISLEQARQAVSACTKAGLRTQCTFIVGFPFDTEQTMALTYKMAKRINPTIAIFFPLTPYPGTKVFCEFMDQKMVPKNVKEWENYLMTDSNCGISVNKDFKGQQVRIIADKWNRSFYLRPKHWLQMIRTIKSPVEFVRLFKGGIYLFRTWLRR